LGIGEPRWARPRDGVSRILFSVASFSFPPRWTAPRASGPTRSATRPSSACAPRAPT